ncbi:MAG: hypothetical protein MJ193_00780 [Clostridia bacterium]|nr:hypothetical protein [Clostridia bacterium]
MNGKKISDFVRTLTDHQLDKLMELMDRYDLCVTDAVVYGYDIIKNA